MSHEIRTPVNTILSNSHLLFDELKNVVSDELKDIFSSMDNAGSRLIRTIDLILNMAQFQTGTIEANLEKFSLEDFISASIINEYELKVKRKGIILTKQILCDDTTILADKYSIGQILDNLLDNALKYTSEGSIDIIIDRDNSSNLFFIVKDTGIGISEEYIENLFKPFSQEEQGYTRRYDGNGLGLALVKNYCDLNNASISVKSEKEAGTIFKVTFNS